MVDQERRKEGEGEWRVEGWTRKAEEKLCELSTMASAEDGRSC